MNAAVKCPGYKIHTSRKVLDHGDCYKQDYLLLITSPFVSGNAESCHDTSKMSANGVRPQACIYLFVRARLLGNMSCAAESFAAGSENNGRLAVPSDMPNGNVRLELP